MSSLSGLSRDESIQEEKDTLGGGFSVRESDVYPVTIAMAYIEKSKNGATGINFIFKDKDDKEYRETLWVTNREGKNFYVKDSTKHYLAGFLHADGICMFATQKGLSAQNTETKTVKVYNYEAKTEVPTDVEVLVDLLGKSVQLAILKNQEFKNTKTDDGKYVPTDEIKETNSIEKVFSANSGKTIAECKAKVEVADFIEQWKKQWVGVTRDRTKGKTPEVKSGVPNSKAASKPVEDLFE